MDESDFFHIFGVVNKCYEMSTTDIDNNQSKDNGNAPFVITVGRQFGSGGREVARALADELGIAYYDKELLAESAKLAAEANCSPPVGSTYWVR